MTETQRTAMRAAHDALELAQENLRGHGDNCFLHDDGEYNSCFCGLDSVKSHLMTVTEEIAAALSEPVQEPVAWQGRYDPTDLYYRKPPQADVCPLYAAPQAQQPAPVQKPDVGLIVRDCCELDPEDPKHPGTICINVTDLTEIVKRHTAQPPAPPADVPMLTDDEANLIADWAAEQAQCDYSMLLMRAIEMAVRQKAGLA